MNVEMRPTGDVRPYEHNPRINDAAVDAVARSIQEFGFRQPIVVDGDGVIVVGHTRWKAAVKLGLAEVPVHVAGELTPEQAKAYRLADNKLNELSSWDFRALGAELSGLERAGVDLGLIGFSDDELQRLCPERARSGEVDPDDVPEPPDETITQPGDLWTLGDHRLLCGDSANAADVDRLVGGQPIHLVNADPPWNVRVEPTSGLRDSAGRTGRGADYGMTAAGIHAKDRPLVNDFVSDAEFDRLLHAWFGNIARVLAPGRTFYIWGGSTNIRNYPAALKECGLHWHQLIVWMKEHPTMTHCDFLGNHELCFYGWKEGAAHVFLGPNNVPDVWSVKKVAHTTMIHLTEKPVELAVRAIQYSSRSGENVLDLFGGSGSTLIAAEQTGRRAFLMEIDQLYCDVIVNRWEKFTGRKAERVSSKERAMEHAEPSLAECT